MADSIELPLEKDFPFQQRAWIAERVGWTLMAAFLLAATIGAFGRGPLSNAQAESPDGSLALDYERLVRFQSPTELRIRIPQAPSREIELSIPQTYVDSVSITEIRPKPASVRLRGEDVVYRFLVDRGSQSTEVFFRIQMETMGRLSGSVAAGNASLHFRQFVFP
jgi:hypothetical protein